MSGSYPPIHAFSLCFEITAWVKGNPFPRLTANLKKQVGWLKCGVLFETSYPWQSTLGIKQSYPSILGTKRSRSFFCEDVFCSVMFFHNMDGSDTSKVSGNQPIQPGGTVSILKKNKQTDTTTLGMLIEIWCPQELGVLSSACLKVNLKFDCDISVVEQGQISHIHLWKCWRELR